MPEGDDVYLTIAEALPYGDYVSTAYNIVDGILNFGKESKEEQAIRELGERVAHLEQFVTDQDKCRCQYRSPALSMR
ncbi:hypothetical protein ACWDUL_34065 [Nocardia niigatensis]|uniref:hypothetical protein n=1 Tax=Nocardia niigatensis TaxID=209249 RepID=UPI000594BC4D|nr:hypothetical protein [Nocardia niigatensis]